MNPYTTDALSPYTMTGPAMVNIFAPTPRMKTFACVQLGLSNLKTIYIKLAVW